MRARTKQGPDNGDNCILANRVYLNGRNEVESSCLLARLLLLLLLFLFLLP